MEVQVGDNIEHWNYGSGVVLTNPSRQDEVPDEWKHDWQNVVMVQFWYLNNAVVWVQRGECDLVCHESR